MNLTYLTRLVRPMLVLKEQSLSVTHLAGFHLPRCFKLSTSLQLLKLLTLTVLGSLTSLSRLARGTWHASSMESSLCSSPATRCALAFTSAALAVRSDKGRCLVAFLLLALQAALAAAWRSRSAEARCAAKAWAA